MKAVFVQRGIDKSHEYILIFMNSFTNLTWMSFIPISDSLLDTFSFYSYQALGRSRRHKVRVNI